MPRGCSASVRRKFGILFPTMEFHSSSKTVQRIAIIPSLMSDVRRRSCDTHTENRPSASPAENSIFANYSATFSHPPLYSVGPHCVPENIMNYFTRSSTRVLPPAFSSRFSRPAGVHVDLYSAARPINISIRTFACKSQAGKARTTMQTETSLRTRIRRYRGLSCSGEGGDTRNRFLPPQHSESEIFVRKRRGSGECVCVYV